MQRRATLCSRRSKAFLRLSPFVPRPNDALIPCYRIFSDLHQSAPTLIQSQSRICNHRPKDRVRGQWLCQMSIMPVTLHQLTHIQKHDGIY